MIRMTSTVKMSQKTIMRSGGWPTTSISARMGPKLRTYMEAI